jgi:hypothetical protein
MKLNVLNIPGIFWENVELYSRVDRVWHGTELNHQWVLFSWLPGFLTNNLPKVFGENPFFFLKINSPDCAPFLRSESSQVCLLATILMLLEKSIASWLNLSGDTRQYSRHLKNEKRNDWSGLFSTCITAARVTWYGKTLRHPKLLSQFWN